MSSGPVDVKDLLNEGSLGMFGDRYSHLIHELQVIHVFYEIWLTLNRLILKVVLAVSH